MDTLYRLLRNESISGLGSIVACKPFAVSVHPTEHLREHRRHQETVTERITPREITCERMAHGAVDDLDMFAVVECNRCDTAWGSCRPRVRVFATLDLAHQHLLARYQVRLTLTITTSPGTQSAKVVCSPLTCVCERRSGMILSTNQQIHTHTDMEGIIHLVSFNSSFNVCAWKGRRILMTVAERRR